MAAAVPYLWQAAATVVAGAAANKLGADKSGQRATIDQNNLSREYTQQMYGIGRKDLLDARARMSQSLSGAYQPAIGVTQQGNLAAQQAIISGLPRSRAALLGGRVDYGAMRPIQFAVNTDFMQAPSNSLGGQ